MCSSHLSFWRSQRDGCSVVGFSIKMGVVAQLAFGLLGSGCIAATTELGAGADAGSDAPDSGRSFDVATFGLRYMALGVHRRAECLGGADVEYAARDALDRKADLFGRLEASVARGRMKFDGSSARDCLKRLQELGCDGLRSEVEVGRWNFLWTGGGSCSRVFAPATPIGGSCSEVYVTGPSNWGDECVPGAVCDRWTCLGACTWRCVPRSRSLGEDCSCWAKCAAGACSIASTRRTCESLEDSPCTRPGMSGCDPYGGSCDPVSGSCMAPDRIGERCRDPARATCGEIGYCSFVEAVGMCRLRALAGEPAPLGAGPGVYCWSGVSAASDSICRPSSGWSSRSDPR